jgi:CRISPR-associated protein Cst1
MNTVTREPIWFTTGNPFVDMGQEMMATFVGASHPRDLTLEDVETLVPQLVSLYFQTGWNKSLYTVFPNSALNNGKNLEVKYTSLLQSWLEALKQSDQVDPSITCAVSGKPAHDYVAKVYLPMSDAEAGNFQSANQRGTPVNAAVALALQFFPMALVKVGKMLALPQFSHDEVQFKWAETSYKHVLDTQINPSVGVRDTGTFRVANAFFKLVEGLVRDHQGLPNSSVTLYLFNNFNQVDYKAASELYYMPSKVFSFIQTAMLPQVRQGWQRIVRRGYRYVKDDVDDEDELQKYSNLVYNRLLANESISSFFLNRKERCPVVRGLEGWTLFSAYLKEVRGMNQQRLDSLRDLGDRIATLVRDRRKRLMALERARSRGELTDVLYRLTKDAAAAGHDKPLITFDQLVSDVFPVGAEYSDWREVKNLLLFRIYEQLFDDLKSDPTWVETDTDETEEEAA